MAITQTGAIYKALTFDNTSSRNYGVYITGQAVYNAPQRDVEMISIPGRNGAFALDKGRFENIEVTYPAGIFADTEADFAQAVSNFRNFLCSRNGYVRLTDEYNPNEYRMAIYKSGLEVSPAQLKAGEFEIIFDCKPQRWLTSGETAVTVANNGTLTNPTLFESSPMLEVTGYGNITFASKTITVNDIETGNVSLLSADASGIRGEYSTYTMTKTFDSNLLNSGDTIQIESAKGTVALDKNSQYTNVSASVSSTTGATASCSNVGMTRTISLSGLSFTYGTSKTVTGSAVISLAYTYNGSASTQNVSLSISVAYNGGTQFTFSLSADKGNPFLSNKSFQIEHSSVGAYSTKSALGTPTYIDLDIGEAYKVVNSNVVSLNNTVSIPSTLPTLKPGTNTFTKSNTITQLKVVPRWWKV